MSAACTRKAASSILHSPFSDQTHLQFYGHGRGFLTPSKLCFNIPARSLPSLASKPVKLRLRALCDGACTAPLELTAEQALTKEIAALKLQMKQKKKELKFRMKNDKAKLKVQIKDAKKMKKQKHVCEGKTKMKCESEDSSSNSESSDEECESASMRMPRQGQSVLEGGLVVAARASDAIEICNGVSSNVLFPGMESCTEKFSRNFARGRDGSEIYPSSMPSISGFLPMQHMVPSEEGLKKGPNTCGVMSVPGSGFTSNAFSSLHAANRIEVCAGGKCKKAGSEQLLLALQGQIPGSSNVEAVPCKCMGKCSMALNVRVHKEDTNPQHHSHVGVEDASIILGHYFGVGRPSMGVPSLAALKGGTRVVPSSLVML